LKLRLLTVVLAVLLAVLGTAAVLAYVRQADDRALQGQKAVTVLVAQQAIPAGTPAGAAEQEGLLRRERLPAASVPPNAVTAITPALASLVVSAQVGAGQLLLHPMLVAAAEVTGGGVAPPAGLVAVTIALCLPEAVGGAVRAGSRVEVFDTSAAGGSGSLTSGADCSGSHEQSSLNARTRVALPDAQVLSVGPATSGQAASAQGSLTSGGTASTSGTATDGPGSSQGAVLVTLAVTPARAQQLIQLSVAGLPYLALLRP
jgi:pilus assembly protein CpaB